MEKMSRNCRRICFFLLGLGLMTVGLKMVSGRYPEFVEEVYSRGIFVLVRNLLDHSFGLLPFSAVYPLVLALLIWMTWKLYRSLFGVKKDRTTPLAGLGRFLLRASAICGLLVFLLYFLWGFNYDRLPVEVSLGLNLQPLDEPAIRREAALAAAGLVKAREEIPDAGRAALANSMLPEDLEGVLRDGFARVLGRFGYPAPGRVRLRFFRPGGLLMRLDIAGFYFPFTGETVLPKELTPEGIPFAAAHEMAHAYGFAEEGTANFLALLVCLDSPNPVVRYSGRMGCFRYIAPELRRVSQAEYKNLLASLSPGVLADMRQSYENWLKYKSWLSDFGRSVNHLYLKTQGIKEGIKSYNRMLLLYAAYRKR